MPVHESRTAGERFILTAAFHCDTIMSIKGKGGG
jgi:hypothetical protein